MSENLNSNPTTTIFENRAIHQHVENEIDPGVMESLEQELNTINVWLQNIADLPPETKLTKNGTGFTLYPATWPAWIRRKMWTQDTGEAHTTEIKSTYEKIEMKLKECMHHPKPLDRAYYVNISRLLSFSKKGLTNFMNHHDYRLNTYITGNIQNLCNFIIPRQMQLIKDYLEKETTNQLQQKIHHQKQQQQQKQIQQEELSEMKITSKISKPQPIENQSSNGGFTFQSFKEWFQRLETERSFSASPKTNYIIPPNKTNNFYDNQNSNSTTFSLPDFSFPQAKMCSSSSDCAEQNIEPLPQPNSFTFELGQNDREPTQLDHYSEDEFET
jgi:hypothetical protein